MTSSTKLAFLDCGVSRSETPQRIVSRLQEGGLEVMRNPSSRPTGDYLTIRWGSPRFSDLDKGAKSILNCADSIVGNLHKDIAHKKMLEAGVSTPLFWTSFEEARRESRRLGCDFLRRRKHHIQGKDIIRISPSDNLPRAKRSGYYTQYLEKDAEFRFHIFHDRCIGLAQKKPRSDANPTIWNYENGWDVVYLDKAERDALPYLENMRAESFKATKCLGLDFAAIDLIMVGSQPYILEANSAPKLNDANRYAKPMLRWVERNKI